MDDHYQVRVYQMEMAAATERLEAAQDLKRPSRVFRPRLSIDGDQWCALYGENLQDGVAGFGNSPEEAMIAFDEAWIALLRNHT